MRKKWRMTGMLMLATACIFAGCQAKESNNENKTDAQQETTTAEPKRSGKDYAGTGYRLNLGETWLLQEMPGAELYFEYGEMESESDWRPSIFTECYFLDNYDGNPGKWYNAEMEVWKAGGFEILSSERIQEGAVTLYRTELEMSEGSMLQYFVINHNTKYIFGLIPNDEEDIYDTIVLEFDEMMKNIVWEDIVRKDVDMASVEPKEVTEADVEAWLPVYGTGYRMLGSEWWYPYDAGVDVALAQQTVLDGYKELFIVSVNDNTMTLEEGYDSMEKLLSSEGFEVVESKQEIQVGGQKGYSLLTKQELKYVDIYRQTYYTIVNGKEYAFTFQADAEDYAYLKLEKEAMFQSIVFE